MPPRLIARRGLALMLDTALVLALVTAAFLPFTDWGLRLPAIPFAPRAADCTPLDAAPVWLAEALGESGPASLRLCHLTRYGLPDGREIRVLLPGAEGSQRTAHRLVIPADNALDPVTPRRWGAPAVLLVLLLASAALNALGLRSPGKAALGLRITPQTTPRPVLREMFRLGPMLAISLLPLLLGLPVAFGPGAVLAIVAVTALLLTWYYLWPFAHWTGQSRHDQIAGYTLTR